MFIYKSYSSLKSKNVVKFYVHIHSHARSQLRTVFIVSLDTYVHNNKKVIQCAKHVAMLNLSAVESDGLPTYSVIHQPTRTYVDYILITHRMLLIYWILCLIQEMIFHFRIYQHRYIHM